MTDETTALAALLRDEFPPAWLQGYVNPDALLALIAARLIAAGVRVAPSPTEHIHEWEPNTTLDGWRCEDETCAARPDGVAPSPIERSVDDAIARGRKNKAPWEQGIDNPEEVGKAIAAEALAAGRAAIEGVAPSPETPGLLAELNAAEAHWHKRATLAEAELERLRRTTPSPETPGLREALERTLAGYKALLGRKPVRDATETIAEAERALASPPAPGLDVEAARYAAALREIADWKAHTSDCPMYAAKDAACSCGWVEIADVARTALDPDGTALLEILAAQSKEPTDE